MIPFTLLVLLGMPSHAADIPSIVGNWLYYKKVYQGQEIPEGPSATLRLHFDFTGDGQSHLYWWHEGDSDHCSRTGKYHIDGTNLVEDNLVIDPANTQDCSSDPDMQAKPSATTPISFRGDDLVIQFHLNSDPLDFVWKKTQ
jgi:hypothetical protein